ncbi:histidine kinase [Clostridium sp. AL.422]|uniref:sensor histidine kinase n=1 Tax=Clostridium TaxID=1485 RepID=UPI00293DC2CA|nr:MULTISPECIES: histidine kinase [unclassified Clostridium]MDV4149800.1 histidine kinase [Clostridium sp. AL.422]
MKNISYKTIKFRVTLIIITSTAIITFFILYGCLYTFKHILNEKITSTTTSNLEIVSKNIENSIDEVMQLAKWCGINNLVASYVSNAPNNMNSSISLNTYYRVKEELNNSRSSRYVDRLIISNEDGALLQIGSESTTGSLKDGQISREVPYFDELIEYHGFKWIGIKENPFKKDINSDNIIPIIRPIYSLYSNGKIGWVYISLNTDIITDYLDSYNLNKFDEVFISIGKNTYKYLEGKLTLVNIDNTKKTDVKEYNNIVTYKSENSLGREANYIWYKSDLQDWSIGHALSTSNFSIDKSLFIPLSILIVVLLFSLAAILTYLFNEMINKPVRKINNKIAHISIGDFSIDHSIEKEDEIGTIGRGINILSKKITDLIEYKVEYEKQKKDLEFKVLQSQINPHFLYNTLNSIKWMATIQNSTGIPEMTTALARLLKNISKGTDQIISIEKEISLLNEYITIQKYRYGGALNIIYNVEDNRIYNSSIIKFTLQPLVENSIFHGIEPKGREGEIKISCYFIDDDTIKIEIKDDGVGISKDRIKEILNGNLKSDKKSFNNIGIKNVSDRIKLTFGHEYGISIKSVINEYTSIILTIPYVKLPDKS